MSSLATRKEKEMNKLKEIYGKLASKLCAIGADKYVHFIVCMLIAWAVTRTLVACGTMYGISALCGLLVASVAGGCKEFMDYVFDYDDLRADCYGAMLGSFLAM